MKKLLWILIISNIASAGSYKAPERQEYILRALNAFRDTPTRTINDTVKFIRHMDSTSCRSSIERLRVVCLINSASSNCKAKRRSKYRENCQIYSDIVVINKLAEKRFISARERYKIMNHNKDFREAMIRELRHRHAGLATDFALWEKNRCESEDLECISKTLDRYCILFADRKNLSWQYCVGAVVWFVGGTKPEKEKG